MTEVEKLKAEIERLRALLEEAARVAAGYAERGVAWAAERGVAWAAAMAAWDAAWMAAWAAWAADDAAEMGVARAVQKAQFIKMVENEP